jgi:hypothetical protein
LKPADQQAKWSDDEKVKEYQQHAALDIAHPGGKPLPSVPQAPKKVAILVGKPGFGWCGRQ